MTISLTSVAASTTPTVIKTFFQHYKTQLAKDKEDRRTEATDEFMFHEAFTIVKHFISIATTDTVESLQTFTNTYIPAGRTTITKTVTIPLSCCNGAAKLLVENFGEKDLHDVVGGRKWWQVRGANGVQAEWIFSRKDRQRFRTLDDEGKRRAQESEAAQDDDAGTSSTPEDVEDMSKEETEDLNRLQRCMLALHGGGYYFGSPNTHKMMFARFARKFGGRVFAVNYRKAPQYPWPCPLQDALAGYLYLIDPPPGSRHKAISPKNVVLCGDSAGGGLSLALLAVLRDLGRPMPSGAVLMSPWCDMTHSFPSILQNTATDIIPQYGFIHKPSTLWPVPDEHAQEEKLTKAERDEAGKSATHSVKDGLEGASNDTEESSTNPKVLEANHGGGSHTVKSTWSKGFEPLPHLASDPIGVKIERENGEHDEVQLTRQIQLYATNSQVYHGLCSPILQGSLGGLPPLYILAGNSEVLRDEIIYLAHRAAHPQRYQLRKDLLENNPRAKAAAEKFNDKPTRVHLQVYDGQPHVLTLFSFTTSARYAYRAIASFIKHVTGAPTELVNPFPNLDTAHTMHSALSEVSSQPPVHIMEDLVASQETGEGRGSGAPFTEEPQNMADRTVSGSAQSSRTGSTRLPTTDTPASSSTNGDAAFVASPKQSTSLQVGSGHHHRHPHLHRHSKDSSGPGRNRNGSVIVDSPIDKKVARKLQRMVVQVGSENDYNGQVPLRRPTFVQDMIRERVDIRGKIRPLEGEEHLQGLQLDADEVGVLKAGPVQRYLTGQKLWDDRFKHTAKHVAKQRAQYEKQVSAMLEQASEAGLLTNEFLHSDYGEKAEQFENSKWSDLSRLGPLSLAGERPPPSAIAGRRDTREAVELYRQALHMQARRQNLDSATAAKVTLGAPRSSILGVSRVKRRDVLNGAPWKQSTAERQVQGGRARYGLRAWVGGMAFLNRRKTKEIRKKRDSQAGKTQEASADGRTPSGMEHLASTDSNTQDADGVDDDGIDDTVDDEENGAGDWVDVSSAAKQPDSATANSQPQNANPSSAVEQQA